MKNLCNTIRGLRNAHIAGALALLGVALLGAAPAHAADRVGLVTAVHGEVNAGEPFFAGVRRLQVGSDLYVYSTVSTGTDASVRLTFDDRTVLILDQETDVRVESFEIARGRNRTTRTAYFELLRGRARVMAPRGPWRDGSRLQIGSPTAVIEIPHGHVGIEIGIVDSSLMTRVSDFDGECLVAGRSAENPEAPSGLALSGGERTIVRAGDPPMAPHVMPPAFAQKFLGVVTLDEGVPAIRDFYRRRLPGRDFSADANPGLATGDAKADATVATPTLQLGPPPSIAERASSAVSAWRDRQPPGRQPLELGPFRVPASHVGIDFELPPEVK